MTVIKSSNVFNSDTHTHTHTHTHNIHTYTLTYIHHVGGHSSMVAAKDLNSKE